jgi:hypothetical protein
MTTTPTDRDLSAPGWEGAADPALVARLANALYRADRSGGTGGEPGRGTGQSPPRGDALREPPPIPSPPERDGPLYFLAGSALGAGPRAAGGLDVAGVRRDFPALHQHVHGQPLV